ncbi:hypothetical protein ACFQJ7_06190 [Halovenus rubra]|uniref:Uncharacterized protein n=2 Tax=Halovenus rubra TaxID=869890 RepID=A0ACC7DZK4_9EURY|nr:hypothetical protein [Halovenus rubra]
MATWAWLLAYLLGFALLQLYLYRYFMKSATAKSPERTTPRVESRTRAFNTNERGPDENLVACNTCGAYNESHSMYTFCRECGQRLA